MRGAPVPCPGGARVFQRIYTRLGCTGRPPQFVVEFYPYANLTHTIRVRGEQAAVRLSDALRRAPLPVIEAAGAILLGRLYGKPVPPSLVARYREYTLAAPTRRRILLLRRARARRAAHLGQGRHHDLRRLFDWLNRRFFGGRLPRPQLGWSPRPWRVQLGIFDPALRLILLNSRLDRDDVPRQAVAFVLFHEMLHMKHPIRRARCGWQSHSPEFRREERRFPDYRRVRRLLERLR